MESLVLTVYISTYWKEFAWTILANGGSQDPPLPAVRPPHAWQQGQKPTTWRGHLLWQQWRN